jgi:DUF4097 and DUF4098 domain-containing protein YvlB
MCTSNFPGTSLTKAPYLRLTTWTDVHPGSGDFYMRKLCQMFVVAFVFTILVVSARADNWSKTYDLTGKPDFRVATQEANVRIEIWDQNKIEAKVTTTGWHIGGANSDVQILERQQGNAVEFELRQPHRLHFAISSDTHRIDLEIHMPRSAKLSVRTGDGDVIAKGLEGELDFTTSDGRLDLDNVDGALRLHTSDGAARVSGRFDVLELRTSDGQVEVEARPGSQLREAWDVRSSDGNVRLSVPADLAANVELSASDGSITTNIPLTVEGKFSRHEVHGKMNGGGNRLTVRTSDGSVTLDKS